ncbi:MAG: hypothetical protein JWQ75_2550 [Pseudarthrobacter sp.]|nr:hypothetical protein [Pseudarthrobacter sp.]
MSTPPVQPPNPNEPEPGSQPPAPRYGENTPPAPQYGENAPPAPPYGQNPPQYGQNAPQYGAPGSPAPAYGQNPPAFGQNPPPAPQYGQQPFGQQYGQSPYAQQPSGQPGATDSNGVPKLVNISFWLLIGAGIVFVISMLMGLTTLDDPAMRRTFEDAMQSGGAAGGEISYEDLKGVIAGTLVVFAIIGAALYALVAFFIRKGKNWARILGTVFAALSLLGLAQQPSLGTLSTLAGIAAIVLLYLPAAAPYFRKQQPFANPYGNPGNPYGK